MKTTLAPIILALAALGAWPPQAVARMPDASTAAALDALPNARGTMTAPDVFRFMRQITTVGATKPPGAALDHRLGTTPRLDLASRLLDQRIRTTSCAGC